MMTSFYSWKLWMKKIIVREWDYRWFVTSVTNIMFYFLFDNVLSFHKKFKYLTIDEIRPLSVRFSIEIIIPILTLDIFHIGTSLVAQQFKDNACRGYGFDPWFGKIPCRRASNPLQYSCLENARDRAAWPAIVHRVAKSQTWLKRLMHACMHTFHIKFRGETVCVLWGQLWLRDVETYRCLHIMSCIFSCIV